uniref:FGGY_N domain-containing protein n=1 Tax=Enterobius vermicularis TaxID=51028 RepID=A0A0N4V9K3_ENTVE
LLRILESISQQHKAAVVNADRSRNEQNVEKIFTTIQQLLFSLGTALSTVETVCVSGQMHGIVLWNGAALLQGKFYCSPLITWMDTRASTEFIDSLPKLDFFLCILTSPVFICDDFEFFGSKEYDLHPGYGTVSLAWLHKFGQIDKQWDCCGTVMDMFNCYLGNLRKPLMGIQNAFSWGYCTLDGQWTAPVNFESVLPLYLLPEVVDSSKVIGEVQNANFAIPLGVKLFASLGDLQSTVYLLLHKDTHIKSAFLSLGTSAQLGCIERKATSHPLLTVPFFDGDCLVVAASMNGGNVLEFLANKILDWASTLTSRTDLQVDLNCFERILQQPYKPSSLRVSPTFFRERSQDIPSLISGLCDETNLTSLFQESCIGVIRNLTRMFPPDLLREFGVSRLVLAGNASQQCYMTAIKESFDGFDIVTGCDDVLFSASYGAALFAAKQWKKLRDFK